MVILTHSFEPIRSC